MLFTEKRFPFWASRFSIIKSISVYPWEEVSEVSVGCTISEAALLAGMLLDTNGTGELSPFVGLRVKLCGRETSS